MSVVFLIAGVLLVAGAVGDALWTALWVDRAAGPVTARVSTWAWQLALRLFRGRHRALSATGPVILVGTVVGWVAWLCVGWVLVFASDDSALINASDGSSAGWTGRIWYVFYAVFTMGNGDFVPQHGTWQVVSGLLTASGMFLVTMSITYLLSVVSAATAKRAFASAVHGLGRTGSSLVTAGWNGVDVRSLNSQVESLTAQLTTLTEKYLSYPVLQYYHASRPEKSPPLAIAVLDDALVLLTAGVASDARPSGASIVALRASINTFLETLEVAFIPQGNSVPPRPRLAFLTDAGVPTASDHDYERAADSHDDRRRQLLALVRNDGWDWPAERP